MIYLCGQLPVSMGSATADQSSTYQKILKKKNIYTPVLNMYKNFPQCQSLKFTTEKMFTEHFCCSRNYM